MTLLNERTRMQVRLESAWLRKLRQRNNKRVKNDST
jgi:hypothetical protein